MEDLRKLLKHRDPLSSLRKADDEDVPKSWYQDDDPNFKDSDDENTDSEKSQ